MSINKKNNKFIFEEIKQQTKQKIKEGEKMKLKKLVEDLPPWMNIETKKEQIRREIRILEQQVFNLKQKIFQKKEELRNL